MRVRYITSKFLMFANKYNFIKNYSNGVTASGLYLTLGYILESLKLDQSVDVDLAIRRMIMFNSQFIKDVVKLILNKKIKPIKNND
jgi:hypothetical protein